MVSGGGNITLENQPSVRRVIIRTSRLLQHPTRDLENCTLSTPAKIVIIEDNDADVRLLRHALNEQGEAFQLLVLEDGARALEYIDEHRRGVPAAVGYRISGRHHAGELPRAR